jgi:hypothetical protein
MLCIGCLIFFNVQNGHSSNDSVYKKKEEKPDTHVINLTVSNKIKWFNNLI